MHALCWWASKSNQQACDRNEKYGDASLAKHWEKEDRQGGCREISPIKNQA